MDNLLEKIKDRISDRNSPIKTVKGVAEAIGMSEGGFYRMVQRNTTKYATMLALAKALNVEESYLMGQSDTNVSQTHSHADLKDGEYAEDVLQRITRDIHEMKQVFEEQLRAKDRQLEARDSQINQLLELLGKLERAILEPLCSGSGKFDLMMCQYVLTALKPFLSTSFFLSQQVAK